MGIFARRAAVRQLDEKLERIQNNFENNYKDAAQLNLREFEELFHRMCQEGSLSERQRIYYSDKLEELGGRMSNFSPKDQKPRWT